LFIPRIGILNEDHLPTGYNGNERTMVETFIIPSTWRELGVGFYGSLNTLPVNYTIGLMNGLNSGEFENGSVIRHGRFEGSNASANNLALSGSIQVYKKGIKFQVSGYYGGSFGLNTRAADSLNLDNTTFGTPVALLEASIQYNFKGFSARALACIISIPDAMKINQAFANNTPENATGAYLEAGYNFLEKNASGKQFILFARYETLDMNSAIPDNGIENGALKQQHIITGINYLPVKQVAVKADMRFMMTDEFNPALVVNPNPFAPVYQTTNTFFNLGIGFSF
jgi:hypothetical protein